MTVIDLSRVPEATLTDDGIVVVISDGIQPAEADTKISTHAALTTGVHGVGAGAVVGTTLTQTLTNKTLTSPTLTTPTIGDFTNATHDHEDSAGGGTLGTGAFDDESVTNAKLAHMAQTTIKGRASGAGTGDATDLTAAQVVAIVGTADGTGSGLDADLLDGIQASAFLQNVSEDTTPQLGGDLDGQSTHDINNIVNIELEGYADFEEIDEPANPDDTVLRLWAESESGFGQLHFKNSSGLDYEIGRDAVLTVRNTTGGTISQGQWVYFTGSNGTVPTIALARADSASTMPAKGVVVADISNNSFGQIITAGNFQGIDTSAFTEGDSLYISASTAGAVSATRQTGTNHDQLVGIVVKSSVGGGILYISIGGDADPTTTQTLTNKTLTSPTITGAAMSGTTTMTGPLEIYDASYALNVVAGGMSVVLGADSNAATRTDSTIKISRIGSAPYANAQSPISVMQGYSDATNNILYFGGGSGLGQAATEVRFYSASAVNSGAGTLRLTVQADGDLALAGGVYNNGRLALGSNHMWFDAGNNLHIHTSAPSADTDGVELVGDTTTQTLTNKTLTTPTIASFTNATHDHEDAAGGGTLGTSALDDEAVTLAKMQHIATDSLLGRDTASTGDVEVISVGGGLEMDGAGGIQLGAITGAITASAGGAATGIAAGAVDNTHLVDMAEERVKGRAVGAGTGDPTDLTPDQVRAVTNESTINAVAPWVDRPLEDATDGSHFNDNDSSYPAGWTEANAALATNTNELYGFWYLTGGGATTSWKYRKQLDFDVEADSTTGDWISFSWGPIIYRDTQNPADEEYRFGVYADNAGSIDEDTFVRVTLQWDAAGQQFRARAERKDGTTQTNGSWYNLAKNPQLQPLYIRTTLRYLSSGSGERVRGYIGTSYVESAQLQLMNDFMDDTWGQVWLQCDMSRGASGVQNYLYIGGIDRNNRP